MRANIALLEARPELRLNLFDDVELPARVSVAIDRAGGMRSWALAIDGASADRALFVVRGNSLTGHIRAGDSIYQVVPVSGGVHEIREIDTSALPEEAEAVAGDSAVTASGGAYDRVTSRDAVDAIRVLIAYTPAAAATSGDIVAEAQLAIDVTNDAYVNSNMATRVELAAAVEADYVESGDISTDLKRLRIDGDGFMDDVHVLRDGYLADFVSLLSADGGGYCGMAGLMSPASPAFESSAFSVVWLPCASSNWTTAHELGHNMGCQHDRANATSSPALPYAFGFQHAGGDFRTVMAVATECAGVCPRVAHFSNPDVAYLGETTGVSLEGPGMAACALAIDATSPVTTDFRTLTAPADVSATSTFTDRVRVGFSHPWPWMFQVYRAEAGEPMTPLATTDHSPYEDMTAMPGIAYEYWISALTALDEESPATGPAAGLAVVPTCGNQATETPAEQCDDGNTTSGDGCSASCTTELALSAPQERCVTSINDRAVRIAKAQGRENLLCVGKAASETETDVDACVEADRMRKVARAREKLLSAEASLCVDPPAFGHAGGLEAANAAEQQRRAFLGDLFGGDVTAAVLSKLVDPAGAACQKAVAKGADRLLASHLASFVRCKKDLLRESAVFVPENLAACFDAVAADAAEAGSSLAAESGRLSTARLKNCDGVDLAAAFPGACSLAEGGAMDACVAARAACRTCLLFNAADALARDCDAFDNGGLDSSCVP